MGVWCNGAYCCFYRRSGEEQDQYLPCLTFLGPELVEAVRIGYQITRVWETMTWPVGRDLFTSFITKSYARKCAAEKDTPIYCVEKQLMNDLTGKFFQKVETSSFMILMDPSALQQEKVFHMTEIEGSNGEALAWYCEVEAEKTHANFPAHLSPFILGWSKVDMNRMRENLGILTDPKYCPWYGQVAQSAEQFAKKEDAPGIGRGFESHPDFFRYEDTDSIICHNDSWMRMEEKFKESPKRELGMWR